MRLCIVGTSRSGSTLLREMLHAHPEIALFNETHWLPRMFEFVGTQRVPWRRLFDIASRTAWDSGKGLFEVNHKFSRFADVDDLLAALSAELGARGRVTIQEFSETLADVCLGAPASWGDKTPDYGFHMGLVQTLWPKCRFVHIVRDGLDTARSMSLHPGCQLMEAAGYDNWCSLSFDGLYQKYQRPSLPLERYVASWRRRLARIRDEAMRLRPDSYLEIRYEDLLDAPARTLAKVAEWVGLTADAEWQSLAAGMARGRRPASGIPQDMWAKLSPDDLIALNAEGTRAEFKLPANAAADDVRRALDAGLAALRRGELEPAHRYGLSVMATEAVRMNGGFARGARQLLGAWLDCLDGDMRRDWQEWFDYAGSRG